MNTSSSIKFPHHLRMAHFWDEWDRKWEIYDFNICQIGVKLFLREQTKKPSIRLQKKGYLAFLRISVLLWKLWSLKRKSYLLTELKTRQSWRLGNFSISHSINYWFTICQMLRKVPGLLLPWCNYLFNIFSSKKREVEFRSDKFSISDTGQR